MKKNPFTTANKTKQNNPRRASEMVQRVSHQGCSLSTVPGTQLVVERADPCKLSSNLYKHAVAHMPFPAPTHTNNNKRMNK